MYVKIIERTVTSHHQVLGLFSYKKNYRLDLGETPLKSVRDETSESRLYLKVRREEDSDIPTKDWIPRERWEWVKVYTLYAFCLNISYNKILYISQLMSSRLCSENKRGWETKLSKDFIKWRVYHIQVSSPKRNEKTNNSWKKIEASKRGRAPSRRLHSWIHMFGRRYLNSYSHTLVSFSRFSFFPLKV